MWETRTYYEVAVWWPSEGGYGGSSVFATLEEAQTCRDQLKAFRFGHVHIRKVTTEVIERWTNEAAPNPPAEKLDGDPPMIDKPVPARPRKPGR